MTLYVPSRLARAHQRATAHFQHIADLQAEWLARLQEHMQGLRNPPHTVCVLGDIGHQWLPFGQALWPETTWISEPGDVPTQAYQGLLAHSVLARCADPLNTLAHWKRQLRPGGVLFFTTFGPDTLDELRQSMGQVLSTPRVHPFFDMHDVGDRLVQLGFDSPILHTEHVTLHYPSVRALCEDIRAFGVTQAIPTSQGLVTQHHWQHIEAHYATYAQGEYLPVTLELIYGHAWMPITVPTTTRAVAGETVISIDHIRRS